MLQLQAIGNLGSDAEIRTGANGEQFVTFDIAHNESYKNAEGVKVNRASWVSCLHKNINVAPYLKKGTTVYVSGFPSARAFNAADGQPRASLNLIVRNMELLGGSQPNQQASQPAAATANNAQAAAAPQPAAQQNSNGQGGDDLPF
jgi:single-strand DNA-binding protein